VVNEGLPVEIQIRTSLQHRWAEISEKLSDLANPEIKYGGGDAVVVEELLLMSASIARTEAHELSMGSHPGFVTIKRQMLTVLDEALQGFGKMKDDDFPN
jgi:UDP-N-acetylglucosamine enolpyruvyl transferase